MTVQAISDVHTRCLFGKVALNCITLDYVAEYLCRLYGTEIARLSRLIFIHVCYHDTRWYQEMKIRLKK